MKSKRARLDRFLSVSIKINRRDVRLMLAQGRVNVDGKVACDVDHIIGEFSHITFDGQVIQNNTPIYYMLNKPTGVVSATKDVQHRTVIDLMREGLSCSEYESLHIVGRLDYNSSGLMLLTNDGEWSRELTTPVNNIVKQYTVTVEKPITDEYIAAFAKGMYFSYENITTRPVELNIISHHVAQVNLVEGRYHQIKRMFGRFQNKVLTLHRTAVGNLQLDTVLAPGQFRALTRSEVKNIYYGEGIIS